MILPPWPVWRSVAVSAPTFSTVHTSLFFTKSLPPLSCKVRSLRRVTTTSPAWAVSPSRSTRDSPVASSCPVAIRAAWARAFRSVTVALSVAISRDRLPAWVSVSQARSAVSVMASLSPATTRRFSRYQAHGTSAPAAGGSRSASDAAASPSVRKRWTASRRVAPTSLSSRRSAPPEPIAPSWRSSPMARTTAPFRAATLTSSASFGVVTMPTSSRITTSPA